ncbi:hypothetical protein J7L68_00230 [bacterium]|nr:hypothetical protein [bacterium]
MANLNLVIWADNSSDNFYPLASTHPVFELRAGAFSFIERAKAFFPQSNLFAICHEKFEQSMDKRGICSDISKIDSRLPTLFLNGQVFLTKRAIGNIVRAKNPTVFVAQNIPVALYLPAGNNTGMEYFTSPPDEFAYRRIMSIYEAVELDVPILDSLWEIVAQNEKFIGEDFRTFYKRQVVQYTGESHISIRNANDVFVGPDVKIDDFSVLDGSDGPIIIGRGVHIRSGAVIYGPAVIGAESLIMPYSRIRSETTIGPMCRVGGEIEASIILGYSNKYHDGFLGHSYIGEWVNFGALSTNSDLKNNYHEIRVAMPNGEVSTGSNKVGIFVGDHTKFGIGTLLTSGATIGVSANLYGGGMFPKYVPPFIWGSNSDGFVHYKIDKAIETARIVMERRGVEITDAYEKLLKGIFGYFSEDRTAFIVEHKKK